jgi:hypothetical protein
MSMAAEAAVCAITAVAMAALARTAILVGFELGIAN